MKDEQLVEIKPSHRQAAFEKLEFYAFFHFGMCTYMDREWGDGKELPLLFNPQKMDALQWVRAIKSAGMKAAILTCKHHDGFCLWPSQYSGHTVASSPYKDGKGDIVKEVSAACKKEGIKFGIYLSPWDRNHASYGFGEEYNNYFVNQLTELLSNYGEIFSVWLDGACGEGSNGKKQVYDWERYYQVIRELQPKACISVCGPDIRWCGNEAGSTRESEWSVVPAQLAKAELVEKKSQQSDDIEFREKTISSKEEDLGSREALAHETDLIWYPSEVDTSIRPGWFYHSEEDGKVRSLNDLLHIYYHSVGGNSTLLLNIPPTKEGLLHENDREILEELGNYLNNTFKNNWLLHSDIVADSYENGHGIGNVLLEEDQTYFKTPDGITQAEICIKLKDKKNISHVVLKEEISLSQRIEKFMVQAKLNGEYKTIYSGSVVGYKKIARFDDIYTEEIKIIILDSRVSITLNFIGVY